MRIAVVHPYPVHQSAVGGVTRVYQLVRYLAKRHDVTVLTHATQERAPADLSLDPPGVSRFAFALPAATQITKLRWWLDAQPYFVHRNVNPALTHTLTQLDRAKPFDVVHVELAYMSPCLRGVGPHTVRALAEQEVMSQALARLRCIPWRDRTLYERLAPLASNKVRKFERAVLGEFDVLYGITSAERDELQAAAGRPADILPHVVDADRFQSLPQEQRDNGQVLFVGNFAHRPNLHAATWFVEQVWPSVRARLPKARFTVVGPGLSAEAKTRLSVEGVELLGYAPDLAAIYSRAAVVVTPVHSGGGMRGKVLEAFASACAVVGTSISFDGIACVSGEHCIAVDDAAGFADAVAVYASSPTLRAAHGAAARHLVRERYDAPAVFARYEHDLERAVGERRANRRIIA